MLWKHFLGYPEYILLDLYECILSGAKKFISVRSSQGNYVAADKNKIYSSVLLWNNIYLRVFTFTHVPTLTKQSSIGKQNL